MPPAEAIQGAHGAPARKTKSFFGSFFFKKSNRFLSALLMHIVMSCVGTYGDVLPHLAVGQTLLSRGHEVRFLTSEYFRPLVEEAGLNFDSVLSAEDYLAGVRDPDVWSAWRGLRAGWRRLRPAMEGGYAAVARHIRPGESVLTGSSMAFWVRMAQEKFGVRAATIHLAPMFMLSAADPPAGILPGFSALPVWARRGVLAAADWGLSDRIMGPDVNRQRAGIGLAPVAGLGRRWMHSPDRVICAFPDWFCAPAADWPAQAMCAGFSRQAAGGGALEAGLEAFLAAGAPPVVFTPGTGMASGRDFFDRALAAAAAVGRRAVLVTRFRDQLPAVLPEFALHVDYARFELLAPRAAAFVHQGGIGTTGELLAAGTRQVFTPFMVEQIDNAARAERLGVGARLKPGAPVAAWAAALDGVLEGKAIGRACAAAAALSRGARPGREVIADLIEQLAPCGG